MLSAEEAVAIRTKLGLSVDHLAVELGFTSHVVEGWESGEIRVPKKVAEELRWRSAMFDRHQALSESGLPECEWMLSWEREPAPEKLEAHTKHLERAVAHQKSCDICQRREKYVSDRFGELPKRPVAGWLALFGWVAERTERLPEWAQPAVWVALGFGAYSLIRIVVFLPALRDNPRLWIQAALGLLASVSIGATVGLLYGGFRAIRARWRARAT